MPGNKKSAALATSVPAATVVQVFEGIAAILLRLGLDAPRSEQLLRRAFVAAATKSSRASGKKSTQSQIALAAGVSRLDVRKILASSQRAFVVLDDKGQSRVDRILNAWRQDPHFSNGNGRPKRLSFIGANSQFENLVRKYGRDVTPRTLRETLIKNHLVVAIGDRLTMVDQKSNNRRRPNALSDLNSLYSYLSLFEFEKGRRVSVHRNLILPASDAKTLKLIQRKSTAKLEVALSSIESLGRLVSTPSKETPRSGKHRLLITVTLSAESGEKSHES
jgi:hypothetical protein